MQDEFTELVGRLGEEDREHSGLRFRVGRFLEASLESASSNLMFKCFLLANMVAPQIQS